MLSKLPSIGFDIFPTWVFVLPLCFYAKCMSGALMHHGSAASFPIETRFLLSAPGLVLYILNILTDFDRGRSLQYNQLPRSFNKTSWCIEKDFLKVIWLEERKGALYIHRCLGFWKFKLRRDHTKNCLRQKQAKSPLKIELTEKHTSQPIRQR